MKKLLGTVLILLVGFTLVGCDDGHKKPVIKDPEIEDKEDEIDNEEQENNDKEEQENEELKELIKSLEFEESDIAWVFTEKDKTKGQTFTLKVEEGVKAIKISALNTQSLDAETINKQFPRSNLVLSEVRFDSTKGVFNGDGEKGCQDRKEYFKGSVFAHSYQNDKDLRVRVANENNPTHKEDGYFIIYLEGVKELEVKLTTTGYHDLGLLKLKVEISK